MKMSSFATSTLTPISRIHGKIGLNCDHCGLPYETYACWAKRQKNHYCGKPCANAAKIRRVKCACENCGVEFEVIPSHTSRVVTCSRQCLIEKRRAILLRWLEAPENSAFLRYGNRLRGEEIGNAKLCAEQVLAILDDRRVQSEIALEYGVDQSLISQIKSGKVWKHLTDMGAA